MPLQQGMAPDTQRNFGTHTSNQSGKIVCSKCGESKDGSDVKTVDYEYVCGDCE